MQLLNRKPRLVVHTSRGQDDRTRTFTEWRVATRKPRLVSRRFHTKYVYTVGDSYMSPFRKEETHFPGSQPPATASHGLSPTVFRNALENRANKNILVSASAIQVDTEAAASAARLLLACATRTRQSPLTGKKLTFLAASSSAIESFHAAMRWRLRCSMRSTVGSLRSSASSCSSYSISARAAFH